MSEDYKKEIDRLIKIAGVKAVNRISDPIRVEDAFQPKKRKTLKETIKVIADTPEEAQAFMALLQNAGIEQEMPQGDEMEPGDELPQAQGDELPQDGGPPCGMEAEAEGEIAQGADYANSPDEEYEDDPMNTYSTKWNHQKKFRRTNNHGDNPLSLADSLMREWTNVKDSEETEEVIKSADAIPRMVDKDDNPIDGKGPVGPGDIIQRPEVFDPVWGDWGHTPESWSDEQVDAYAEEIIAISKGQDPKIEGFDSYFDALGDGMPVDVEGGKYDADDIMDIINDTIGGQMNSVIGGFLELYMGKDHSGPELPDAELQKDALRIVRDPEFKKSLARVRSGQQEQVGEEEAIDPVWGDWGYTPESWSDMKVGDNAEEIIALSKGQDPNISWDIKFDELQDMNPHGVEGSKYEDDEIFDIIEKTIGGKVRSVISWYLEEAEDTDYVGPPSPEVQKAALEVVNNPEFKKSLARVRSGQQEQVGEEELNRIKELSGIDKQVGEVELKRYGNYRRRN